MKEEIIGFIIAWLISKFLSWLVTCGLVWLGKQPLEDKLVYMRYKYSWEDRWTVTNEYLEVDMSVDGYYIWLKDWNEGQEDVEILGCIDVDKIDVPLFSNHRKVR